MKAAEVHIGRVYHARISGNLTNVRIENVSVHGGWIGRNLKTDQPVRIRTAGKLRGEYVEGAFLARLYTEHAAGELVKTQSHGYVKILRLLHKTEGGRLTVYSYSVQVAG